MFPSILLVDDEPSILKTLGGLLSDEGFEIITASNGYEALKTVDKESPDLVLLDIWMPGIDGIETLKQIKKENPQIQVIMITGHGTIETAVRAVKFGAFDFIEKPLTIDRVIVAINNALNFRRLEEENRYLRKKTLEKNSITGNSPPIAELKKQIAAAAPSDAYVLITGENGTGKELVARTIHQFSPRAEYPLVEVNCAAIPPELIESELLGYEKGAFSGSTAKRRGKVELASKGTLFLDEICDMELKTQAKLLRVLQEQKFERIGGTRTLGVNLRVIAATNKDIRKEIEKGNFREDLYYRLNVIPIDVPPLRKRTEDIPLLIDAFLKESLRQHTGGGSKKLTGEALELLCRYPWPGNVRELKNLVERLVIMVEKEVVDVSDLPSPHYSAAPAELCGDSRLFQVERLKDARVAFEDEFIKRKLKFYDQDIQKTAEAIGLDKGRLNRRVKKLSC
jgi:two-component system nitrogen regulation response regulator NtrX